MNEEGEISKIIEACRKEDSTRHHQSQDIQSDSPSHVNEIILPTQKSSNDPNLQLFDEIRSIDESSNHPNSSIDAPIGDKSSSRLDALGLQCDDDVERRDAELFDVQRRDAERLDAERLDVERLDVERLDVERRDVERRDAERREAEINAAIRSLKTNLSLCATFVFSYSMFTFMPDLLIVLVVSLMKGITPIVTAVVNFGKLQTVVKQYCDNSVHSVRKFVSKWWSKDK